MSWGQGREVILQLLDEGALEHVVADLDLANRLLEQATTHLTTAEREAEPDPYMAYSALYDGARKALTALLQVQGLRPTRQGGHVAVIRAIRAQLDPPLGRVLRPLDRMRRTRHDGEYPSETTMIRAEDVTADLAKAREIVAVVQRVVQEMTVFVR